MYSRFLLMLGASFIVMYVVMYLNVASFDHAYLNLNRFYMTVLMVAPMALIMFGFMSKMYKNTAKNAAIVIVSVLAFIGAFVLERNQTMIEDKGFMHSMIPHHSSAILVSEEADLSDPEVQKLAEEIIKSQKEEIAQMKKILERM
ncbi:DUF305 domain-containing protein [Salinimicrobium marinum]|nr:DUF305 domain-containing protein [Salinimicrobium marinum]